MRRNLLAALSVMMGLAGPAPAATYTYDIDYDYPILRLFGTGSSSNPTQNRTGRGSLSGTITLDDSFTTTYRLLSFNLTSINTANGFTAVNLITYNSSDPNDTYSSGGAPTTFQQVTRHTLGTQDGSLDCSAGAIAPSGQHANRQYRIGGSTLLFDIDRNFQPGDAQIVMGAVETFGRAPLCFSNGFADLGYEHTYFTRSASGTLNTGGVAPEASVVPLPAALPLLLLGLGGLAVVARGRRAATD